MQSLGTSPKGLELDTVAARQKQFGPNTTAAAVRFGPARLLLNQFRSPLMLVLVFATVVSMMVRDILDAAIVLVIVVSSAALGFLQEYRASNAIARLRDRVSIRTNVIRGGKPGVCLSEEIVPGDIVTLAAGSLIPGDGILLDANDFFVSEATLTGETFPVEKRPGVSPEAAPLSKRTNCIFMGTSVRSGTATALIVHTGRQTAFGAIAQSLRLRPPENELERGLRRFGMLLLQIMIAIVLVVVLVNLALERPTIETLLFAVALAVGIAPELLPTILTITLSKGAQLMAREGVIVRRLNAIENLGSMEILCCDKTGTLTEGLVRVAGTFDAAGQASSAVFTLAALNAMHETGLANPLDAAILTEREKTGVALPAVTKLDEMPYDFARKRLSVVLEEAGRPDSLIVTKGAVQNVLDISDRVQAGGGELPLTGESREKILETFAAWSREGFRVLGIATRRLPRKPAYDRSDEAGLAFAGFILFFDPPRDDAHETLDVLRGLGVRVKIITGDNQFVSRHVAESVGLKVEHLATGADLDLMSDEALWRSAPDIEVFAEVDPNQKERIILALRRTGHVVGFLGDGINDAPALHAADVGISVDQAADVAKDAADLVLLEHSLEVLSRGISEGRRTFANTLKYILVTTSANFGNMISMAAASFFLPFLPLLAKQILLANFLSDIPAIGISGDRVDEEWEHTPHRWDIGMIRRFMIQFGLLSSLFDGITFLALLAMSESQEELFRTGWFVESLLTELAVFLVIRTHRPFYKSRPGRFLLSSTLALIVLAIALPYLPYASVFGFTPLPAAVMLVLLGITGMYVAAAELLKHRLYHSGARRT
jgi:Mg2+-importing ATPase